MGFDVLRRQSDQAFLGQDIEIGADGFQSHIVSGVVQLECRRRDPSPSLGDLVGRTETVEQVLGQRQVNLRAAEIGLLLRSVGGFSRGLCESAGQVETRPPAAERDFIVLCDLPINVHLLSDYRVRVQHVLHEFR